MVQNFTVYAGDLSFTQERIEKYIMLVGDVSQEDRMKPSKKQCGARRTARRVLKFTAFRAPPSSTVSFKK